MAQPAYTQAQLDTLRAAIAQGALEVWYGDKRVKYRSLQEMETIEAKMVKALTPVNQRRGRAAYPKFNSGL